MAEGPAPAFGPGARWKFLVVGALAGFLLPAGGVALHRLLQDLGFSFAVNLWHFVVAPALGGVGGLAFVPPSCSMSSGAAVTGRHRKGGSDTGVHRSLADRRRIDPPRLPEPRRPYRHCGSLDGSTEI
ncbi:MAG: hypothetical protein Q8N53_03675 [Longimicrobiales bacterium]|nr:hypothetical protein [Longimicrobiales bacterium]